MCSALQLRVASQRITARAPCVSPFGVLAWHWLSGPAKGELAWSRTRPSSTPLHTLSEPELWRKPRLSARALTEIRGDREARHRSDPHRTGRVAEKDGRRTSSQKGQGRQQPRVIPSSRPEDPSLSFFAQGCRPRMAVHRELQHYGSPQLSTRQMRCEDEGGAERRATRTHSLTLTGFDSDTQSPPRAQSRPAPVATGRKRGRGRGHGRARLPLRAPPRPPRPAAQSLCRCDDIGDYRRGRGP